MTTGVLILAAVLLSIPGLNRLRTAIKGRPPVGHVCYTCHYQLSQIRHVASACPECGSPIVEVRQRPPDTIEERRRIAKLGLLFLLPAVILACSVTVSMISRPIGRSGKPDDFPAAVELAASDITSRAPNIDAANIHSLVEEILIRQADRSGGADPLNPPYRTTMGWLVELAAARSLIGDELLRTYLDQSVMPEMIVAEGNAHPAGDLIWFRIELNERSGSRLPVLYRLRGVGDNTGLQIVGGLDDGEASDLSARESLWSPRGAFTVPDNVGPTQLDFELIIDFDTSVIDHRASRVSGPRDPNEPEWRRLKPFHIVKRFSVDLTVLPATRPPIELDRRDISEDAIWKLRHSWFSSSIDGDTPRVDVSIGLADPPCDVAFDAYAIQDGLEHFLGWDMHLRGTGETLRFVAEVPGFDVTRPIAVELRASTGPLDRPRWVDWIWDGTISIPARVPADQPMATNYARPIASSD